MECVSHTKIVYLTIELWGRRKKQFFNHRFWLGKKHCCAVLLGVFLNLICACSKVASEIPSQKDILQYNYIENLIEYLIVMTMEPPGHYDLLGQREFSLQFFFEWHKARRNKFLRFYVNFCPFEIHLQIPIRLNHSKEITNLFIGKSFVKPSNLQIQMTNTKINSSEKETQIKPLSNSFHTKKSRVSIHISPYSKTKVRLHNTQSSWEWKNLI